MGWEDFWPSARRRLQLDALEGLLLETERCKGQKAPSPCRMRHTKKFGALRKLLQSFSPAVAYEPSAAPLSALTSATIKN